MTKTQATGEAFWTAFQALRPDEKQAVLERLLQDKTLRRDLQDLATIASRKNEPARPLRKYLVHAQARVRRYGPGEKADSAGECGV